MHEISVIDLVAMLAFWIVVALLFCAAAFTYGMEVGERRGWQKAAIALGDKKAHKKVFKQFYNHVRGSHGQEKEE